MSEVKEIGAVYTRQGDYLIPSQLARGPWSAQAQHGGAPAALLAGLAESAVDDGAFFLSRLTLELVRPVPIAPLTVAISSGRGKSVRRVELVLSHEDRPVARANALLLRAGPIDIPEPAPSLPLPGPQQCSEPFRIPGMPAVVSFHNTAMETRLASGSTATPGPAAVWFRFAVPFLEGAASTPVMRAVAAADFGNGISWTLPFDTFVFANTDLTVYLHRPPCGEWVALDSETCAEPSGVGLVRSTLYDERGRIGVAQQNLLIRRLP